MNVYFLDQRKTIDVLTLISHPKNIARVEPYVETVFRQYNLSADMYGNILISLTEAVTNAIMHGNGKDESKKVSVSIKKYKNKLGFIISDEGTGFNFGQLPDPTSPENVLQLGGRGVFLMRQLSDQVLYHDNGSTVEIQFNI